MNKLNPRNKKCFQTNEKIHITLNLDKLKKKKWNFLKKKEKKKDQYKQKNTKKKIQHQQKNTKNEVQNQQENKKKKVTIIKSKPEKRKKFFQRRLFEKQKLKFFYGCIPEYQLKNLFQKLKKKKNKINIFKNFLVLLESRLDVIIFRLKLSRTIFAAKQLINHNKIQVNNNIINKSNFLLKKGDIVNLIK